MGLFSRNKRNPAPDPLQVALDVTVADLRRVASDLQKTADAVRVRVDQQKEKK